MHYKYYIIILLINILSANVDEYISLINNNLMMGKFLDATVIFDKAVLEYDSNAELYYVGAQLSIKMDNLDQANKYFLQAIKLDKKNEKYRNELQELAEFKDALNKVRKTFDSGLIDDSINEYEKLAEKYPEHAIVFYNLGLIYKVSEEYDLAVENYHTAQALNPFEKKYSLAVKAIAQISAKEGDEEYRRQEFDSAIKNYQKAIFYYPEYTTAMFKLARTYYKLKDFENARIYLEQGLSVDPKQEKFEKMLGDVCKRMGALEEAVSHYNQAIEINSNYNQAFYSLGSLYLGEGKLNEAREALNNAILIEPTYIKAYGTLGTIEQELGNIDIAIQNFSKALEYDPKAFDIHYRLSSAYNIKKQYKNAKLSAKESLNIKRNYAPAFYELGLAEMNLCNIYAAKDALEKAKKDRNFRREASAYLKNIDYYTKDCN